MNPKLYKPGALKTQPETVKNPGSTLSGTLEGTILQAQGRGEGGDITQQLTHK